jgi:hypothetical protein
MAAPKKPSSVQYLTAVQVAARYAVCSMSLHRWLRDPNVGFPQPALIVNTRRYWAEDDLVKWERSRRKAETAAA